jgi:hypothetical protein
LTEKWFMLWLLYCPPVLFKVWQRSTTWTTPLSNHKQ